jgi:hypothetical protein
MFKRSHIIIASLVIAAGVAVTGWLIVRPTYDEIVKDCQKALAAQSKAGGKGKPSACKDVKEDDYNALVFSNVIDGLGWTDEEGHFDKNKMLEDSLNDTP